MRRRGEKMEAVSYQIKRLGDRLKDGPFRVSSDVDLGDGQTAAVVASRTYFSWKGFVLWSQHIVIQAIARPTPEDVQNLFSSGFRLAKKRNRVPLLRGMQFGYMIVPVIVAEEITRDLFDVVTRAAPKRWALLEFPVICEAATGNLLYFRKTALWGALFFADLRAIVETYLTDSSFGLTAPNQKRRDARGSSA